MFKKILITAMACAVAMSMSSVVFADTTTNESTSTTTTTEAVAEVNGTQYSTLPEAVSKAGDGDTITLLKDAEGDGVIIKAANAKKLTFDFGGHTYTVNGTLVGSTGHENQSMHFEKGWDITLENGTLVPANSSSFGIQNYADLTLKDFTIDASANSSCGYALSCNNGAVSIEGNSSIKVADGQNAFDVCLTNNYPDGARVTVDTTGTIDGNIQYDLWGTKPETNKTGLTIKNGIFTDKFDIQSGLEDEAAKVIKVYGGTFAEPVPYDFLPAGYVSMKNSEGTYTTINAEEVINNSESELNEVKTELNDANVTINDLKAELNDANVTINDLKAELAKVITPSKTNLKLYKGKSKFTAKWNMITDTTGYELKYGTSKKFSKKYTHIKYVKSYKTTKITFNKYVKSHKKYYAKIRTYRQYNGKKYYSKWSSVKTVRAK